MDWSEIWIEHAGERRDASTFGHRPALISAAFQPFLPGAGLHAAAGQDILGGG